MMRAFYKILISFIVILGIYTIGFSLGFAPHGFWGDFNFGLIVSNLLLAAMTISGVICRNIYCYLDRFQGNQVDIKKVFKQVFKSKGFWRSILISPIILITVFKAADQLADNIIGYLFAFQNGFFFESIFEDRKKKLNK